MFPAQATRARVLLFLEHEHAVNDWNPPPHLNLRQRVRHAPTHVLRVAGFALENHPQADDRRERRIFCFGQLRGDGRNLEGTGHADYFYLPGSGAGQFSPGRLKHGLDVPSVILGGDDGKAPAVDAQPGPFDSFQHQDSAEWTALCSHRTMAGVQIKCPSFSRFTFRYFSLCGFGRTRMGTCSTISRP